MIECGSVSVGLFLSQNGRARNWSVMCIEEKKVQIIQKSIDMFIYKRMLPKDADAMTDISPSIVWLLAGRK